MTPFCTKINFRQKKAKKETLFSLRGDAMAKPLRIIHPPLRSIVNRVGEMKCPKISLFEQRELEIFNGMSHTLLDATSERLWSYLLPSKGRVIKNFSPFPFSLQISYSPINLFTQQKTKIFHCQKPCQ